MNVPNSKPKILGQNCSGLVRVYNELVRLNDSWIRLVGVCLELTRVSEGR